MKPPLSRIPLLGVTVAFAAGIVVAESSIPFYLAGAAVAVAVVLALFRRHYAAIVAVAAALGIVAGAFSRPQPLPQQLEGRRLRYAAVVKRPVINEGTVTVDCMVDSVEGNALRHPIRTRMVYLGLDETFDPGARIAFTSTLENLDSRLDLPDERDFNAYLRLTGYEASTLVTPGDSVKATAGRGLACVAYRMQQSLVHRIACIPLQSGTQEFLIAVLTGDRSLMPDDTRQSFARAGIAHVLALSGLHVAIIAVVIGVMLYPLYFMRMRRLQLSLTIAALWAFALLTGMSPSVVRAVIMATLLLVGRMTSRAPSSLNSLCAAALLILVFTPRALFTIGFQLSFAAVASILIFSPAMIPFSRRRRVLYAAASYVAVTLSAMMAAGVLSIFYFHQFPVYFLVGNIVGAWLMPAVAGLGIVDLLLSFVGDVPGFLITVTDFAYDLLSRLTTWVDTLPGATVDDLYFNPLALIPFVATLAFIALALYGKRKLAPTLAAVVTMLITVATAWMVDDDYPAQEYFMVNSDGRNATLVVRDVDSLYIITTAAVTERPALLADAEERYDDYRGRRGLKGFSIAPDTLGSPGAYFSRRGDRFTIGGHRMAFVTSADSHGLSRADSGVTLIVARGYTGDIVELRDSVLPDSIVLTTSLNSRRARRYRAELDAAGAK